MPRQRSFLGSSRASAAVAVRLVAFLVGTAGVIAIPASLVAAAAGHVTPRSALAVIGGAVALILMASLAVRSFDPLRG